MTRDHRPQSDDWFTGWRRTYCKNKNRRRELRTAKRLSGKQERVRARQEAEQQRSTGMCSAHQEPHPGCQLCLIQVFSGESPGDA